MFTATLTRWHLPVHPCGHSNPLCSPVLCADDYAEVARRPGADRHARRLAANAAHRRQWR
jgi:hypothetical protein